MESNEPKNSPNRVQMMKIHVREARSKWYGLQGGGGQWRRSQAQQIRRHADQHGRARCVAKAQADACTHNLRDSTQSTRNAWTGGPWEAMWIGRTFLTAFSRSIMDWRWFPSGFLGSCGAIMDQGLIRWFSIHLQVIQWPGNVSILI